MRFCGDCGGLARLGVPGLRRRESAREALLRPLRRVPRRLSPVRRRLTAAGRAPVAERRLVSVLFADLVGFTAASEGRDAEDTRLLLSRYFETCQRLISLYGGTVEKFIGDAVMAVWGTPLANEDDAERAVRTALDLVAAVPELDAGLSRARRVLTGEAAVTLGARARGWSRAISSTPPRGSSRRRARHRPRRRGDEARDRGGDRLRPAGSTS